LSQKGSGKSSGKELRIVTKKVVSEDLVKKDAKKMKLLKIINELNQISERSLTKLLYLLKNEKNVDLGYKFIMLGDSPSSREVAEDLRILLSYKYPQIKDILKISRFAVNGEYYEGELKEGDVVAIIPPVSGG
jgi:molybdopterin converting factor small subunit